MRLKTKIRAGKVRPNHNITVHRTAASGCGTPAAPQGFGQRLSQHRRGGVACGCCEERRII
jgi:hypothetical protein